MGRMSLETCKILFDMCDDYISFQVLKNNLLSYLTNLKQKQHNNYEKWLESIHILVKQPYFLGYLSSLCAKEAITTIFSGKKEAQYILFLNEKFPGKIIFRGMVDVKTIVTLEFDPLKGVPNAVYKWMTTLIPLRRTECSFSKIRQPTDLGPMLFASCTNCKSVLIGKETFEKQCRYNSTCEKTKKWIPCPKCKKGQIFIS
jgi:hypothetical protein